MYFQRLTCSHFARLKRLKIRHQQVGGKHFAMGKKGLSRIALHVVMEKKQLFKEAETVFFVLFRYPHFPFHSE